MAIHTDRNQPPGLHLSREYVILWKFFVRDDENQGEDVHERNYGCRSRRLVHRHETFPSGCSRPDSDAHLAGVITHKQILDSLKHPDGNISDWMNSDPLTASHMILCAIVNRWQSIG
jgi:hypothetical protein